MDTSSERRTTNGAADAEGGNWSALREAVGRPGGLNIGLALAAGVLVAALVAVPLLGRPAAYLSQATLLIDQPRAVAEDGGEGYIVKLSRLRVKYRDLAGTAVILAPLAERLGEPMDRVRATAGVTLPLDALVIHTTGTSSDPELAHAVAEGLAEELVRFAQQEQAALAIEDRIQLSLVDPARQLGREAPSPFRAVLVIAVLSAVVAGAVFLLLQAVTARRS